MSDWEKLVEGRERVLPSSVFKRALRVQNSLAPQQCGCKCDKSTQMSVITMGLSLDWGGRHHSTDLRIKHKTLSSVFKLGSTC